MDQNKAIAEEMNSYVEKPENAVECFIDEFLCSDGNISMHVFVPAEAWNDGKKRDIALTESYEDGAEGFDKAISTIIHALNSMGNCIVRPLWFEYDHDNMFAEEEEMYRSLFIPKENESVFDPEKSGVKVSLIEDPKPPAAYTPEPLPVEDLKSHARVFYFMHWKADSKEKILDTIDCTEEDAEKICGFIDQFWKNPDSI